MSRLKVNVNIMVLLIDEDLNFILFCTECSYYISIGKLLITTMCFHLTYTNFYTSIVTGKWQG